MSVEMAPAERARELSEVGVAFRLEVDGLREVPTAPPVPRTPPGTGQLIIPGRARQVPAGVVEPGGLGELPAEALPGRRVPQEGGLVAPTEPDLVIETTGPDGEPVRIEASDPARGSGVEAPVYNDEGFGPITGVDDAPSGWTVEVDLGGLGDLSASLHERLELTFWSECDDRGCTGPISLDGELDETKGVLRAYLTREVVAAIGSSNTVVGGARGNSLRVLNLPAQTSAPGGPGFWFSVNGAAAGPSGDFSASDFSDLASASVATQYGHVVSSYEFDLPPAVGPVPQLRIDYSSGSVDGRNSSKNNQPTEAGLGWGLNRATISRAGHSCEGAQEGNQCFNESEYDGFVLSMDGVSGRLVYTDTSSTLPSGEAYREYLVEDNQGWRVRRISGITPYTDRPMNPVAMAAHPNGDGYWMVTATGSVYAYGSAAHHGGGPGVSNIVDIEPTSNGAGYWLVGSDGAVYEYGNATDHSDLPDENITVSNIVGMAARSDNAGYWLAGADGGIFGLDATFQGNMFGQLNGQVINDIDATGTDKYVLSSNKGGVFAFPSPGGQFHGSAYALGFTDFAGIDVSANGDRYLLMRQQGQVYGYGTGTPDGQMPGADDANYDASDIVLDIAYAEAGTASWALQRGGRSIPMMGADWTIASHPDRVGTRWELTSPDGTLYTFGGDHEPGSNLETHSVRYAPYQSTSAYGCSWDLCDRAYAWDLDRIEDTSGNTATLFYEPEFNWFYPQVATNTNIHRGYMRANLLAHIDYGFTAGQETSQAPFRADLIYQTRQDGGSWPDTPTDLGCAPWFPCTEESATFWTKQRLATVTTQVDNQAGGWTDVQDWVLTHDYAQPPADGDGDVSEPKLRLMSIQRQSGDGTLTMPPAQYTYAWENNRVNFPNGVSPMRMYRLTAVVNELGGRLEFDYGQSHPPQWNSTAQDCWAGDSGAAGFQGYIRMPCDMFIAHDAFTSEGGAVLWNKWKVETETRLPTYGGSPNEVLTYTYQTPPSWHYNESFGRTAADSQCPTSGIGCGYWSDYRGHERVRVTDASGDYTDYWFHTGMHGDRDTAAGGSYSHSIVDSGGSSRIDYPMFTGRELDRVHYDNSTKVFRELHLYYQSGTSGTKWPFSRYLTSARTYPQTYNNDGVTLTGARRINYFDSHGNVTRYRDDGQYSTPTGDETTTVWYYTKNTSQDTWIVNRPHQMLMWEGTASTHSGQYLDSERYYYDEKPFADQNNPPDEGLLTRLDVMRSDPHPSAVLWSTANYRRNSRGQIDRVTDPTGNLTYTGYNSTFGYVSSINPPLDNNTTNFVVDPAWGAQTQITAPNSQVTNVAYDGLGRIESVTLPGAPKESIKYTYAPDEFQTNPAIVQTETLREPGAGAWEYTAAWAFLDGFGRVIQTQTPDDTTGQRVLTTTDYDNTGRVYRSSSPQQFTGTAGQGYASPGDWSAYDSYTQTTNPATGETRVELRDGAAIESYTRTVVDGLSTDFWDAKGYKTTQTVDIFGRLVETDEPSTGGITTYDYNLRGDLTTVTDDANNTTTINYPANARWRGSISDPDSGTWSYEYDAAGRLTRQNDGNGQWLHFTNDALGRLTHIRDTNSGGALLAKWAYDPTGHVGLVDYTESYSTEGAVRVDHTYNTRNRLTQQTWTAPGLPGTTGYLGWTYNEDNTVNTIAYNGTETVDYTYNHLTQPISAVGTSGATYATDAIYTPTGQPASVTLGAGTDPNRISRVWSYDNTTHRLDDLTAGVAASTTDLVNTTHFWDDNGNLERVDDNGQAEDRCYTYDNLDRLKKAYTSTNACTSANTNPPAGNGFNNVWTYNAIGNITNATGDGTPAGAYSYAGTGGPHAVNTAGTSTFSYDTAGNQTVRTVDGTTHHNTYDQQNRLTDIGTTVGGDEVASFLYDADGARVARTAGTETTYYLNGIHEITTDTAGQGGGGGGSTEILFVVKNPASLEPGETAVQTHLVNDGWTVTLADDDTTVAADANGKAAVLISQAVAGAAVGNEFAATATPVMVWKPGIYDDMGLVATSSDYGTTSTQTQVDIADPNHPIATGLTGTVSVYSSAKKTTWGQPAQDADIIATTPGATNDVTIFAYDTGDTLADATTANGKRVGFYLDTNGANVATNDGWTLFDNTIDWLTAGQGGGGSSIAERSTVAIGGAAIATRTDGGDITRVVTDHLGSPIASRGETGGTGTSQLYYPYGLPRGGEADLGTPGGFTGQISDLASNSGLLFYHARYFDPGVARFTQPDSLVPDPGQPQDWNRYTYVRGNPLRYTDPTGHCPGGICIPGWAETYLEATSGGRLRTELVRDGSIYAPPDNALNTVPTTILLDDDDSTEIPGTLWLVDSCPVDGGCSPLPGWVVTTAAVIATSICIVATAGICGTPILTAAVVLAIGAGEGVANHALHATDQQRDADGYAFAAVEGAVWNSLSLVIPGAAVTDDTIRLLASQHAKPTTAWEIFIRGLWLP